MIAEKGSCPIRAPLGRSVRILGGFIISSGYAETLNSKPSCDSGGGLGWVIVQLREVAALSHGNNLWSVGTASRVAGRAFKGLGLAGSSQDT